MSSQNREPAPSDELSCVVEALRPSMGRRTFLRATLGAGTVVVGLGGASWIVASEADTKRAQRTMRPDGRPRLPPNQYLLQRIRPMGGVQGDPSPGAFRLRVYGEVERPFTLDFAELLGMPQTEQSSDVHCVTKWTCLDARFTGVRLKELAERAKVKPTARHVIFEAAAGYSANVLVRDALADDVLVAHKYEGQPLARAHGAPVRIVVPDLYFWKSAKWLTAIRFSQTDRPGYWETRGYHNHADPWKEERYG